MKNALTFWEGGQTTARFWSAPALWRFNKGSSLENSPGVPQSRTQAHTHPKYRLSQVEKLKIFYGPASLNNEQRTATLALISACGRPKYLSLCRAPGRWKGSRRDVPHSHLAVLVGHDGINPNQSLHAQIQTRYRPIPAKNIAQLVNGGQSQAR
jgi:hypothetical protein